jgi:hypothetical protein
MSTTLDEGATALLRKPFAESAIGKLPRSTCSACSKSDRKRCEQHQWVPNCQECHGSHSSATMHLDYVGHAATTDRLLAVDPEWSWEPMALDLRDRDGNLWIRLTVRGMTRLGVGDGRTLKECIGDAIRNAAMRFGVALDLWSKDELEQISNGAVRLRSAVAEELAARQPAAAGPSTETPASPIEAPVGHSEPIEPEPEDEPEAAPVAPSDSPLLNTSSKLARRMFALFGEIQLKEKDLRLAYVTDVVGRPIESSTEMTDADAVQVIAAIERDLENPFPKDGAK